jgi:outer membrane murein-binding lipoprotein Lpp
MADNFPMPGNTIGVPVPTTTVKAPPAVSSNIQQVQTLDQTSQAAPVSKVDATAGAAVGWSPDQARQGLDITTQRSAAESQRVYKRAQAQVLTQLQQQIQATEAEISTETAAINQLQSDISGLQGQIGQLNSQISSMQQQIAAAKEAARRAAEEAARQAAMAKPVAQAASPASYETPNGGWIGQDYYADVNAARAAAAAPVNYNSPKAQLANALRARKTELDARRDRLNTNYPQQKGFNQAALDEYNAIVAAEQAWRNEVYSNGLGGIVV